MKKIIVLILIFMSSIKLYSIDHKTIAQKIINKDIITDVINLQYANVNDISKILENILSPKMYIPSSNGKLIVKKINNNIDISLDERTNSIIVTAPKEIVNYVREFVQKIDQRTKQVVIKVLIAEITIDEKNEFGVEWKSLDNTFIEKKSSYPTATVDFGNQNQTAQNQLLGLKYGVMREDKLMSFLQALKDRSKINVLSSPQLLTSNNSIATFEETTKVPLIDTTTTSNGIVSTSVKYEEVGIKLKVKPRINIDDYVKLNIEQNIQNILQNATIQNAPTYANRRVDTDVIVKDGHTVIIGGLFKNNENISSSKVPILGDLPIIKGLFRRENKTTVKTELMVFITPHIVRKDRKLDKIIENMQADELKKKLKELPLEYKNNFDYQKNYLVMNIDNGKLLLNIGKKNNIKKDQEFKLIRPGKKYFHPETNQLLSTEEKEIGRIKIEKLFFKTSIAKVIYMKENFKAKVGDIVKHIDNNMAFKGFKITDLKLDFYFNEKNTNYSSHRIKAFIKMKNSTKDTLLKTTLDEGNFVKNVKFYLKENNKLIKCKHIEIPDKDKQRTKLTVFFNRFIKSDEQIEIIMEYSIRDKLKQFYEILKAQQKNKNFFTRFTSNFGASTEDVRLGVIVHFPAKIEIRNFDFPPIIITDEKGTSLIWNKIGGPLRVKGETRYIEPKIILNKLNIKY